MAKMTLVKVIKIATLTIANRVIAKMTRMKAMKIKMDLFLSSSSSITGPGNPGVCRYSTSACIHPTHTI